MKKHLLLVTGLVLFAINSFAKEGLYIEFKMTSEKLNGVIKSYSSDGDTRTESTMTMSYSASPKPYVISVLKLHTAPNIVYSINEKDKTYSETDISKVPDRDESADYEITVLGREKVNNYNCTHVKVVNKSTQHEMELWLSKDIPQYERYAAVKNKYLAANLYKRLKDKGAEGFTVRITMNEAKGGRMQMDLVKAEQRNIDASLFSLSDYTRTSGPATGSPDMQKLQNMTPEERQKYIDQLKQQYQPH